MKKKFIIASACVFLIAGCAANEVKQKVQQPPVIESSEGDKPLYNIDQMLQGKTDLIVLVKVESADEIKNKNMGDPEGSHQEAILRIDETFFGQASSEKIKLYQSTDKVALDKKYVMFLSFREELNQYVLSDGASLSELKNDKIQINVAGIKGEYSKDELDKTLKEKINKK